MPEADSIDIDDDTEPGVTDAGWSYTVSVRALCEFTAKAGDLDRRFTPSATAMEGLRGQQTVASRRGPDYETEVALEGRHGGLRVRGRADGYDPRRRTLEEVKAIRGGPDDIPDNRRLLHWAQLQTYGALFCHARGVEEIALALVYFDVASQTEVELRQVYGAAELDELFDARCADFAAWAEQEAAHRVARDEALHALAFPEPAFRTGQRALAEAVYRSTASGRCLLAQAPTGIGKTIGTLFPTLRAMPVHAIDKLAYLTCKGTGRLTAMEALETLRDGAAGRALRVVAIVTKDRGCEHPGKACHADACPLAAGFYDRLPAARAAAVAEGWLDAEAQRRIALRHGLCPYYLGQELLRWGDVLVGDVHHFFDPNGQLFGLTQALGWKLSVLVDEAHNLVDRTRQMYSAELRVSQLQAGLKHAPAAVHGAVEALLQRTTDLVAGATAPYAALDSAPDPFVQALQAASGALAEHFHQHPLAQGPLLDFFFAVQRFTRLVEALGDHSLLDVQTVAAADEVEAGAARDASADRPVDLLVDRSGNRFDDRSNGRSDDRSTARASTDATLSVRNVAPAPWLRPRFKALHSATLFSATLAPPSYAVQLLGLPENTAWIDVPPAFAPEHLHVQVATGVSTRFAHRRHSLSRLVDVLATQFDAHPGNYLAFFSSFEYLAQAADALAQRRPDLPQWRQDRRMNADARQSFLGRFVPMGRGIGFAVLGGVFAEGVDLPGSLLIGAFVATLGLPPVSVTQDAVATRLEKLYGPDQGYADLVPAMQKVVQAAGRVLRTPEDRGWLWLLDDRYRRPDVVALLPPWWGLGDTPADAPL